MSPTKRTSPATGSVEPSDPELTPAEEPNASGTLFLTVLILIVIGAIWVVMYRLLIER